MVIKGVNISLKRLIYIGIYYGFAQFLPGSYSIVGGRVWKWIRYQLCSRIFKHCGQNVNIERRANFGTGRNVIIGDNSGLGAFSHIPSNTIIGNYL